MLDKERLYCKNIHEDKHSDVNPFDCNMPQCKDDPKHCFWCGGLR